jgi:DDE family transposase
MNYALLYQWERLLSAHLPSLNSWQQANVALFSYGVMESKSSQQEVIAGAINCGEQIESGKRRLRRMLDNEGLVLDAFFGEWVKWVSETLGQEQITLLVDETKLHDRIGVMMVGLAWEGRCLPLVWRTYKANNAQAYPVEGQVGMIAQLLATVKDALGSPEQVLVLADRGIGTSPDLCKVVARLGWRYLFRVTCQTKIITDQAEYTIAQQVQPGEIWMMSGQVFKQRGRIPAQALALWSVGYDEPWALVTNDECLTGHEYARRNWQEQSFRDLKSGGWHWGESRVRSPEHMARLLILLVLAYVWVISLGSLAVAAGLAQPLFREKDGTLRRHRSLFKEGLSFLVEVVQRYTFCPPLCFIPDFRFT